MDAGLTLITGTVVDLADQGGRQRAKVTIGAEATAAAESKLVLAFGSDGAGAAFPPEAILGVIQVGNLQKGRLKKDMSKAEHVKHIPAATKRTLEQFQRDAERACSVQRAERQALAHTDPSLASVQQKWRLPELKRQLLFHNPCIKKGHEMGDRSSAYTEGRAIAWAKAGVSKLRHVLHDNDTRLLSTPEFTAKWPALRADADVYERLQTAIPQEWTEALARGGDRCEGEHTWH